MAKPPCPGDGKVLEESGMMLKEIGSGCICCEVAQTFANTVAMLGLDFKPDVLLVPFVEVRLQDEN